MQKYKDQLKLKKRRKFLFKMTLCLVAIGIVAVGSAYLLFFADLLNIRNIEVNSTDELRADLNKAIENWLDSGFWRLTPRNNLFLFSAGKLSANLASQFPKLESVSITKNLPHSLVISAKERSPVGIWCQTAQSTCFYFDKNGIAFSETQPSSGFLITNVTDKRQREIKLGSEVISRDWFERIISVRDPLERVDVNVSEFIIPADSFDEFDAKTAEGWKIMFSIQTDLEKQINALAIFLKEKIKPDQRSGLQYIDLRIQDRIYYK